MQSVDEEESEDGKLKLEGLGDINDVKTPKDKPQEENNQSFRALNKPGASNSKQNSQKKEKVASPAKNEDEDEDDDYSEDQ